MKFLTLLLQILLAARTIVAFQPISTASHRFVQHQHLQPAASLALAATGSTKSGQGFGSNPKQQGKKTSGSGATDFTEAEEALTTSAPLPVSDPAESVSSLPPLNQGQKALEALRRERAEKKDAELRKVKEIRELDKTLQESPGAAVIPEKVANRMGKRMIPFVGIPLFGVLGSFVAFWYFATYKDLEVQPSLVATSTIVFLGIGLLGITYSVMSASWDDDREGSALGFDEFKRNTENIKGGLSRSRENALIREKMAGLSEEEIESAIRDLDRRDTVQEKRQQSFESKLGDEMK